MTNPADDQHDTHDQVRADAGMHSSGPATATIRLPFVSVDVSLPQFAARLGAAQPRGAAPSRAGVERLAFYGGAAVLGALGVLEWPVVLVAAGGTYVLSQLSARARTGGSPVHSPHPAHDHAHDEDCGHVAVPHGDHTDYLHDGHRHAAHDDHWDEH